jgi:hypothetical protein
MLKTILITAMGIQLIWSGMVQCDRLTGLYEADNRVYFAGKLPPVTVWLGENNDSLMGMLLTVDGEMYIAISHSANSAGQEEEITMLHEMCHAEAGSEYEPFSGELLAHGPEVARLYAPANGYGGLR